MAEAIKIRTLLFQLLLTCGVLGVRHEVGEDVNAYEDGEWTICGDEDIWVQVSSPSTVEGIRGINWKSISETVEEFMENQQVLITTTDSSIEKLRKAIKVKEAMVAPRDITKEEIEELVLSSVSAEEAFTDAEAARETKCGKPGHQWEDKQFLNGFDNSVAAMAPASDKFFTSEIKSKLDRFTTICEDFLGFVRTGNAREDDLASYCDEMCAEMARVAQDVSDERATAGLASLVKLKQKLAKLEADKQARELSQKQCQKEWNRLEEFKAYMQQLQTDISVKHKTVMQAEWALYEASQVMEETVAALDAQHAKVVKVTEGLTPLAEAASEAKNRFESVNTWQAEVNEQLKSVEEELARLTNDLEKIRQADVFATDIKQRLSILLLKIDGHNEEALREPLRKFGITEDYDAYAGETGFLRDVTSTSSFDSMTTGVAQLHATCQKALVSFQSLKPDVDLTPLCVLPQQDKTVQQLGSAVQAHSDHIVAGLMKIQSWLSPYKGNTEQPLTFELEATKYVDAGEPLGLRRMFGIHQNTRFFKDYLVHWKRHGRFLQLLASLGNVISDLDKKIQAADERVGKIMDELFQAEQQLTEAVAYLEVTEHDAKVEKENEVGEVELLEAALSNAQDSLNDLQLKLQQAIEQWRAAKDLLISSHAGHTSGESLLQQQPGLAAISPHAQGQI
mmetsp:Transcript_27546/g.53976  ORF Transcript_27546/g.53976 Transcript_27546/m.53976 type:complete len:679 (+) Transcript_27546:90-2126(+)